MKRFGKLKQFLFLAKLLANCVNTFVKARRKRKEENDCFCKGYKDNENSQGGKIV